MRALYLVLVLFFLDAECFYAQCNQGDVVTFQKVYGGIGNERGHAVCETTDGGFAIVGETTSFGAVNKDLFVLKTDINGVTLWTKRIGTSNLDDGNSLSITQTLDGGYLIAGHTNGLEAYVLKLDVLGAIQWSKKNSNSIFRGLKELSNGDFILTGNEYSFGTGGIATFALRLSPLGIVIWSQAYGGTGHEQTYSVIELPLGDLIFSSGTSSFGISQDCLLMRTDALGNVIWSKSYGGSGIEHFYSSNFLSDGNLISVGTTNSFGSGSDDMIFIKTDLNGNVIWTKTFGGFNVDRAEHIEENQNGEIIFTGYSNSFGGNFNFLLGAIDLNGNLLWSKKYGGSSSDEIDRWGKSIAITSDNGIVLVGGTNSFSGVGEDIYLIKTNECGNSFCNDQSITLSSTSPIIMGINAPMTRTFGGNLINVSSFSITINFTENYLCADTAVTVVPCNLNSNFSSSSFCFGDSTFFNDLSVDNNGIIQNWQWYFGDGDSLIGIQNAVHLYGSAGSYNVTLVVTNDSNCIDSTTIQIDINPVYSFNTTVLICQGDSLLFGRVFRNTSGMYTDSLQTFLGCDSLLILNLIVNPTYQINLTETICQGDSIFLAGAFQNTAGIYIDNLQTILLCDSIINTTLIVGDVYYDSVTVNICEGDSMFLGGNFQTSAGVYNDSSQSVLGCDSTAVVTLMLDTIPIIVASNDTTIIVCSSAQLNADGALAYTWWPNNDLSCTNCASPIASPYATTIYVVTGSVNGCSSKDTVIITVEGESELIIPNVFSPNFDGVNDGFNVEGGCLYSVDKKIFNRWGELLFHS